MTGLDQARFAPHDVAREDRADGNILLRSNHALGDVARCTGDWLDHWATATPDAVFLAERAGEGWREVTYAQAQATVRAVAAALLDRGVAGPILVLSGNSVNHGLLTLAAQYVGIVTVPIAEAYARLPSAAAQLAHMIALTQPTAVYAEDAGNFAETLARDDLAACLKITTTGGGDVSFDTLTRGGVADVDAANRAVTPDTVAKILMTSGSTSLPKGVETTQRMMTTNQAQIAGALRFVTLRAPRIVDWLPWNHVFGGSHNFNLMLANGGALYIDAGKPVPPLVEVSIDNLRRVTNTMAFNVPVGFAQVLAAMREDAELARRYFEDLDMLFYAGASLPQEVWAGLEDVAREVTGRVPLFTSSWGLTETAPACLLQSEPAKGAGTVGVPLAGITVKLVPDSEPGRYDVRVKGPSIFTAYHNDPAKTAEAFDSDGFFITGDAMSFVDAEDPNKGMRFAGRMAEEFKLATGTWVRAAGLRLDMLGRLEGLAQDVVVTGAERMEVGLLIVPHPKALAAHNVQADGGALVGESLFAAIAERLAGQIGGSSARVARVLVMAEPPSIGEGEATAKGNLNFRKLLNRRADLVARLYDDTDTATLVIPHD